MGDDLPVVDLGTGRSATAIAATGQHTCVLLDDDTVKCWGSGDFGALGYGDSNGRGGAQETWATPSRRLTWARRQARSPSTTGVHHTCAFLNDDSLKCWGANNGQLGLGDYENRGDEAAEMGDDLPAVALGTGRTATAATGGYSHTCALLDDNTVKCWGFNAAGQLGYGDTANRGRVPGQMGDNLPGVALGSGRTAAAVAAGAGHTCALLDNGTVKCWGDNGVGQLGYGDTADRADQPGEMGDALPIVLLVGLPPPAFCDSQVVTVDLNLAESPTVGADVILGTPGPEVINALGGADRACGGGGVDTLNGGYGNDRLLGQVGNDTLNGGDGADTMIGGTGADTASGGNQDDTASGGDGADRLNGQSGRDTLNGVAGSDVLDGGPSADRLNGGTQNDTCHGRDGQDTATSCEVRTGIP